MSDPVIEIKLVGDDQYADGANQLPPAQPSNQPPTPPESNQEAKQPQPPQGTPDRTYPNTGRRPDHFPSEEVIDQINDSIRDSRSRKKKPKPAEDSQPDKANPQQQSDRPDHNGQDFKELEAKAGKRLSDLFSPAVVRRWTDHLFGRGMLGQFADTFANSALKNARVGGRGKAGTENEYEAGDQGTTNNEGDSENRNKSLVDHLSGFIKSLTPDHRKTRKEEEFERQRAGLAALRERADRQIESLLRGENGDQSDDDSAFEKVSKTETAIGKFTDAISRGVDSFERTVSNITRLIMIRVSASLIQTRRTSMKASRATSQAMNRGLSRARRSRSYRRARIAGKRMARKARKVRSEVGRSIGRTRIGRGLLKGGRAVSSKSKSALTGITSRLGLGARGGIAASGGGGLAGGAAGLAGGMAIGAAAAVAAFLAVALAARMAVKAFENQANELEEVSGAIVASKLKIQANLLQNQIERAQKIEGPVAQVNNSRGRLEDALYELSTEFLESFSKLAPIVEGALDMGTILVRNVEIVTNQLQSVADYARLDFEGGRKNAAEAATARAKLAEAMAELVALNKEDKDNPHVKWLLNLDPFGKVDGNNANPGP